MIQGDFDNATTHRHVSLRGYQQQKDEGTCFRQCLYWFGSILFLIPLRFLHTFCFLEEEIPPTLCQLAEKRIQPLSHLKKTKCNRLIMCIKYGPGFLCCSMVTTSSWSCISTFTTNRFYEIFLNFRFSIDLKIPWELKFKYSGKATKFLRNLHLTFDWHYIGQK